MLKNIPTCLSPDLLKTLMEMGHGDEIVLGDGNFPAASHTNNLIRCDGLMMPELLTSILKLMPLDGYVGSPFVLMKVATGDHYTPEIWEEYRRILADAGAQDIGIDYLERDAFYERSKHAFAVIATSEKSLYANIILKKGVIA